MSVPVGIAGETPRSPHQDIFDDPYFQWQQEQEHQRRREQNRQQQAYNQIAAQNAANQRAGLQLDAAQLGLSHQQNASRLLQDLLGAQFQTMLTEQGGQRTLNDLASRLLDTRFNVDRLRLQDELRLAQQLNDRNRVIDSSASRARRLIGG